MAKIFLLLGSNIGDSKATLSTAADHVQSRVGPIVQRSSIYRTAAWGNHEQDDFLNEVIVVESMLAPGKTLSTVLEIEAAMGRRRSFKNAPRTIDIDILFYDNRIMHDADLQIPHPEIGNRRFVLVPMNEIAPTLVHPETGLTMQHMLDVCKDDLNVQKI